MARAMYFTLDQEDLSYHIVPSTPYLRKGPAVSCRSPAATVPNIDTTTNLMQLEKDSRRQAFFMRSNSSPHPNSLTFRVPSISPKTPVATRDISTRPREQLVPSQTPFVKATSVISTIKKTTSNNETCVKTLHLFSDDDSIFL